MYVIIVEAKKTKLKNVKEALVYTCFSGAKYTAGL
jgi:hypothetical protein